MKHVLTLLFCLSTIIAMAQKPKPKQVEIKPTPNRPIKIDIKPELIPHIKLLPDLTVQQFNIATATHHGTINGEVYYKATFNATVRNIGNYKTGAFYVAFFVNDYSHPHSGDGWWARETQKNERVELRNVPNNLRVTGYIPLLGPLHKNTVVVNSLAPNASVNITGTLLIKRAFVNHYHITAAADCKKGAVRYRSSEGSVNESNELNNKAKVMPSN